MRTVREVETEDSPGWSPSVVVVVSQVLRHFDKNTPTTSFRSVLQTRRVKDGVMVKKRRVLLHL